jgi:hypothetical protein
MALPEAAPLRGGLAPIRADAALLVERRLIAYVQRDGTLGELSGYDVVSGTRLWQSELSSQPPPLGHPDVMAFSRTHFLLRVGGTLSVHEVGSGARAIVYPSSLDLTEHGSTAGRRTFATRGAVCGFGNRCDFQLIDCDDARPIGAPINGGEVHRFLGQGGGLQHTTGCGSFRVEPIGRDGDLTLLAIVDGSGGLGARALDRCTGAPRWTMQWPELGGVEGRSIVDAAIEPNGKSAHVTTETSVVTFATETGRSIDRRSVAPSVPSASAFELRTSGKSVSLWRRAPSRLIATLGDGVDVEMIGEYIDGNSAYAAVLQRRLVTVHVANR